MNNYSNVINLHTKSTENTDAENTNDEQSLNGIIRASLSQFLNDLDGETTGNIYDLVMSQVEQPLLELVMQHVDGNQSKAAESLGINRGTLRKKLKIYNIIK